MSNSFPLFSCFTISVTLQLVQNNKIAVFDAWTFCGDAFIRICGYCGKILDQDLYATEPTFIKDSSGQVCRVWMT